MSSILTNSSALTALQSLEMTQQALAQTQNEVSTGLRVATAADNTSYWSIAAQLRQDSGISSAANDALSQSQSILDTANSAIDSVITTLNSMATTLTQAQNPGADIANINTTLAALGQQLSDAVKGASFNGTNVLNGTQGTMDFISGYNASSTGGAMNTIAFTAEALTGGSASTSTTTTSTSTVTDSATITKLQALDAAGSAGPPTPTFGNDTIVATAGTPTTPASMTIESVDLYGNQTTTTYVALDSNGNNSTQDGSLTFANAASLGVLTTVKTSGTTNLLTQNSIDLTGGSGATSTLQIGTTITAANALTAVNQALAAVTNYAALIGATQNRMTTANTFNQALTTDYANGVSGLVDADMNAASAKLQALQTQQQLGIQSLAIANQNSQLILKLFQ